MKVLFSLNQLTIRSRLAIVMAVAVAVSALLAAINFYAAQENSKALTTIYKRQVLPLHQLDIVEADLKEVRFRMAGVLLDQMPVVGSLNHLKEVQKEIPLNWGNFKQQTAGHLSEEEMALADAIDEEIGKLPIFIDKLQKAYSDEDNKAVASLLEDDWPSVQGKLLKPLAKLAPLQQQAVGVTYERSTARNQQLLMAGLGAFAVGLIVVIGVGWHLTHKITININTLKSVMAQVARGDLTVESSLNQADELGEMSNSLNETLKQLLRLIDSVRNSGTNLGTSVANLASEATEIKLRIGTQQNKTMQIGTAIEQMSTSIAEVARSTDKVEHAAMDTQQIAKKGREEVAKLAITANSAMEAVAKSDISIANLSQAIGKVSDMTNIIRAVAEQTNLLALNAAIEAARAGEHGRGFAVVADEVRSLAARTAESTQDIGITVELINNSAQEVTAGMATLKKHLETNDETSHSSQQSLQLIVDASTQVAEMAQDISRSVNEQAVVSQAVAKDMADISVSGEDNLESMQRLDQSAKAMANTAVELDGAVTKFKVS
jgi:methyl-accepting chemotaxis protein